MFLQYKMDTRVTLELSKTDKATVDKKRRREFHKIRGKFDLENKGINAFTQVELKRLQDL